MYLVYHFSKKLTSLIDLAQLTVKIILLYFKYCMLINLHLFGFQSRIVSSQKIIDMCFWSDNSAKSCRQNTRTAINDNAYFSLNYYT